MKSIIIAPCWMCYLLGVLHRRMGVAGVDENGVVIGEFIESRNADYHAYTNDLVRKLLNPVEKQLSSLSALKIEQEELEHDLSAICVPEDAAGTERKIYEQKANVSRIRKMSRLTTVYDEINRIEIHLDSLEAQTVEQLQGTANRLTSRLLSYAHGVSRAPVSRNNIPPVTYVTALIPYYQIRDRSYIPEEANHG